jgi:hypothetical protein
MVAFEGEKGKRYCKLTLFLCRSRTMAAGAGRWDKLMVWPWERERELNFFFVNVEYEANGSICFLCRCPNKLRLPPEQKPS